MAVLGLLPEDQDAIPAQHAAGRPSPSVLTVHVLGQKSCGVHLVGMP